MSISKGGQSVKPYVGSKEVKEAYVGSQLVYRAVPPFNGVFFDGTTRYILEGYTISPPPAAITDFVGTSIYPGGYYIDLSSNSNYSLSNIKWSGLDIPEFNTLILSSANYNVDKKDFVVVITFSDGSSINTNVSAWYNVPGRIDISGKKITELMIKAKYAGNNFLISNISLV